MTERPALFSGPMVRAILSGQKTQTRRVVKPQPTFMGSATLFDSWHWINKKLDAGYCHTTRAAMEKLMLPLCPYGQPGDRLWVRETFMDLRGTGCEHRTKLGNLSRYAYAAESPPGSYSDQTRKDYGLKWTPSIHMPRAASRITLEITAVRVERTQDISGQDAIAEGIETPTNRLIKMRHEVAVFRFQDLWESINGPGSWALNPWVWVIEFREVK